MNKRRFLFRTALRKSRSEGGFQIVEMLISIFVLSIFLAASTDSFARVYTQGTASQNEVIAANIAQQLIDIARNTGYTTLSASGTADGVWHDVGVYATSSSGQPSYINRPLLIYGNSSETQSNQFHGTVRQSLSNLGSGRLQLLVEVSWPSELGSGSRLLSASSLISQYGIHN